MGNDTERKDVTVAPAPVAVDLTHGLEGDRSTCCYATIERRTDGTGEYIGCLKCGNACGLLTEDQKTEINGNARGAIARLINAKVVVVVIHKPTDMSTSSRVSVTESRKYAEAAIASFPGHPPESEFVVVEVSDKQVRVSTLANYKV